MELTNKQLDNRMAKYMELKAQKKELEKLIEAQEKLIEQYMEEHEVSEIKTAKFAAKLTEVASKKFDSAAFKADHAALYEDYKKESRYTTFTVKALA